MHTRDDRAAYFRDWRLRRMSAEERAAYELRKAARAAGKEKLRAVAAKMTAKAEERARFARAREEAIAAGSHTYIGWPCKCGCNVRYVGAGGYKCKACNDAKAIERAAQMKRVQTVDAAGPLGTSTDRTNERGDCTKNEH